MAKYTVFLVKSLGREIVLLTFPLPQAEQTRQL